MSATKEKGAPGADDKELAEEKPDAMPEPKPAPPPDKKDDESKDEEEGGDKKEEACCK